MRRMAGACGSNSARWARRPRPRWRREPGSRSATCSPPRRRGSNSSKARAPRRRPWPMWSSASPWPMRMCVFHSAAKAWPVLTIRPVRPTREGTLARLTQVLGREFRDNALAGRGRTRGRAAVGLRRPADLASRQCAGAICLRQWPSGARPPDRWRHPRRLYGFPQRRPASEPRALRRMLRRISSMSTCIRPRRRCVSPIPACVRGLVIGALKQSLASALHRATPSHAPGGDAAIFAGEPAGAASVKIRAVAELGLARFARRAGWSWPRCGSKHFLRRRARRRRPRP